MKGTDEESHGVACQYYDSLSYGVHMAVCCMFITLVIYFKGSLGEEHTLFLVYK
jgi:hypothetical protein